MKKNKQNIVILGANGFVGSRLCEVLLKNSNFEIVPLVRNLGRAARIGRLGLTLSHGDVLDQKLLESLISKADFIVNLLNGGRDDIVHGTTLSARLARKHGVSRYVHLSSAAVYGIVAHQDCIIENAPLQKTGHPYSDNKLDAELAMQKEIASGLSAVLLRPRVVWGPYSSWTTDFFETTRNSNKFCLIDDGAGACNTIYVDNLVDSIIWALDAQVESGSVFFVRDREQLTWLDYYKALGSYLPSEIRFSSIESSDLESQLQSKIITRKSTWKLHVGGILTQGAKNLKRIEAFKNFVANIPEVEKLKFKRKLGLSWPEREIVCEPRKTQQQLPNMQRLNRERGLGFTNADKIFAAGWTPPYTFEEGLSRTVDWLRAAAILPKSKLND